MDPDRPVLPPLTRRAVLRFGLAGLLAGATAEPGAAVEQAGWYRCRRCLELFSGPGTGRCVRGHRIGHRRDPGDGYVLFADEPEPGPDFETGWRSCRKCRVLHRPLPGPGPCPRGGRHSVFGSPNYALRVGAPPPESAYEGGWRRCRKCRGLWRPAPDGGRGRCPQGGGRTGHLAGGPAYSLLRHNP